MLSIKTDGKDLLDSKVFMAVGLGETTISVGDGAEALCFIFDFYQDDKESKHAVEFEAVNEKTLRLKLTNWDSPLGATWSELAEVGVFKRRKLYLLPYIKKAGSSGQFREVMVSFYLGQEDGAPCIIVTAGQFMDARTGARHHVRQAEPPRG